MRHRVRGFTLLEAMVALAILGGTGMALFSWISTSVTSQRRVEDANRRSEAIANTIEYMQTVNPMQAAQGRFDFGDFRVEWDAVPTTAKVDGVAYPRGLSSYQLALYDTHVNAVRGDDAHWFELRLQLVGFKRVREMGPLL